jgi:hypothetical protein
MTPVTIDYAEERPDSSPVNRVSMVENCAPVPSVELWLTWVGSSPVLSGLRGGDAESCTPRNLTEET